MDKLDKNWIISIIKKAEIRLERTLEEKELEALSETRSLMAYEMIEDTLDDKSKTKEQINNYVQSISKEG
tara:strand:+ start:1161 stop:1370 length:210 start_codon:yes stop_codon:yes gene_type:complete